MTSLKIILLTRPHNNPTIFSLSILQSWTLPECIVTWYMEVKVYCTVHQCSLMWSYQGYIFVNSLGMRLTPVRREEGEKFIKKCLGFRPFMQVTIQCILIYRSVLSSINPDRLSTWLQILPLLRKWSIIRPIAQTINGSLVHTQAPSQLFSDNQW